MNNTPSLNLETDLTSEQKRYFPFYINIKNRKIIIFGGGNIGERKYLTLKNYNPNIIIYSFSFTDKLLKESINNKNLKLIFQDILCLDEIEIEQIIKDSILIIPATNNIKLNNKIIKISKKSNILVNCVTHPDELIFPSIIEKNNINIAISTGGLSPTITKNIKNKIKKVVFKKELNNMIKLQRYIKEKLQKNNISSNTIKDILYEISISRDIIRMLKKSYIKSKKEVNIKYSELFK